MRVDCIGTLYFISLLSVLDTGITTYKGQTSKQTISESCLHHYINHGNTTTLSHKEIFDRTNVEASFEMLRHRR
jgi:hypothetical protein